jgi:hypothetical protein
MPRCANVGTPTHLQKFTTSVVRGHPPTYSNLRHSVNLVLNLVLLVCIINLVQSSGGPTYIQKCTTFRRRGDPPTYRNIQGRHRTCNLPTPGKERNPGRARGIQAPSLLGEEARPQLGPATGRTLAELPGGGLVRCYPGRETIG